MDGGWGWKIEFHFFQKVTTFLVKGTLWNNEKSIFSLIYEKSNRCPRVFRIWVKRARPVKWVYVSISIHNFKRGRQFISYPTYPLVLILHYHCTPRKLRLLQTFFKSSSSLMKVVGKSPKHSRPKPVGLARWAMFTANQLIFLVVVCMYVCMYVCMSEPSKDILLFVSWMRSVVLS